MFSSSIATHIGKRNKQTLVASDAKQNGRSWTQVVGSGGVATMFALTHILKNGFGNDTTSPVGSFFASFVASFAFGAADTWASEIGVLSTSEPRMITTWKKVPCGTNGGVTVLGTISSCLGGILVGITAFLFGTTPFQPSLILLGFFSGMLGSMLDSFLGATFQFTGVDNKGKVSSKSIPSPDIKSIGGIPLLSNTQVNFVSSLIVGIITYFIWN